MLCKKCLSCPLFQCLTCQQQIPAGYGKNCESCSWRRILGNRIKELVQTLVNPSLKGYFKDYMNWLDHEIGPHKAALLIIKHIQFFEKTNDLWSDKIPDYELLLHRLRASGLRKYELPVRWLVAVHHLQIDTQSKGYCSEYDQLRNLANSCTNSPLSDQILQNYYKFLTNKMNLGKTSIRSARLAMKPASALMLLVSQSRLDLPTMWHVKYYLFNYLGQASATVGFLNFLNKNYDTNLDTSWVLDEKMTEKINMKKLEKQLLAIMNAPEENFTELEWIQLGLMYFHNLNKFIVNHIDSTNFKVLNDGYIVRLGDQQYWIPKLLV